MVYDLSVGIGPRTERGFQAMISHGDGRKEHVGCVVREMERNGYHDSDFYALVYDKFASCSDCRGSGWTMTDGEIGKQSSFGEYSDAAVSYGLTLSLMDGVYASEWVPSESGRGGTSKRHPYAETRKYLTSIQSYMGVPEPFACATCSGSGKVPHPDGGYFHWIEYGTTRFACDTYCRIDATDEVKALYTAWVAKNRAERREAALRIKGTLPERGARVRVVKGRKIPKGTEGTVFWHGADKYRKRYAFFGGDSEYERVGFETDDGEKFFTAASNLDVLVHDGTRWVEADAFVRPGDHRSLYVTEEGWATAPGYAYVG